jgi:fatty-acyl-CoA synthase
MIFAPRCRRFASYLSSKGFSVGDIVAAMLPNVPAMYELHFAVPMAGAVLNALNIRLDAPSIAFQLDQRPYVSPQVKRLSSYTTLV